jgi:4-amino-4-deoxy-L-arabinose transferase-like glycosyltransferase
MYQGKRFTVLLVIFLLFLHAVLVCHCAVADFATYDEAAHIAAGLFSWKTGRYYFYSVNPPLTKQLAVAPITLLHPDTHSLFKQDLPGLRDEIPIANKFARDNAAVFPTLLVAARLPGVAWSVLGGGLVFYWSRRLFGTAGGLLSLTVWCFEPNIIAHAHLVTADVPSAVAAFAATVVFAGYLRSPSWGIALISGILLGIAEVCKFTLVVLYPVWLLLWLLSFWRGSKEVRFGERLAQLATIYAVSLLIINVCYECSGSYQLLGQYQFVSKTLAGHTSDDLSSGNRFAGTMLGKLPVPLPEYYLRGIDLQRRGIEGAHQNYLRGEWRSNGWWYYYVYGLGVKVPLGAWALLLVAAVAVNHWVSQVPPMDLMCLILPPLAILVLLSSQSNLNGHTRYALLIFPFAIVLLGGAGAWAAAGRWWRKGVVGGFLTWLVISALAIHPCELSYFNELAGGPNGGVNHLRGSNLDWGQDLWRLKDWLTEHPEARPLYLAYHGGLDPDLIGIAYTVPPLDQGSNLSSQGPHPGWYAVSIAFSRGDKTLLAPHQPSGHQQMLAFEYFRYFQPVAQAGYSVLIYHITMDEANGVRDQLGLPLLKDKENSSP